MFKLEALFTDEVTRYLGATGSHHPEAAHDVTPLEQLRTLFADIKCATAAEDLLEIFRYKALIWASRRFFVPTCVWPSFDYLNVG